MCIPMFVVESGNRHVQFEIGTLLHQNTGVVGTIFTSVLTRILYPWLCWTLTLKNSPCSSLVWKGSCICEEKRSGLEDSTYLTWLWGLSIVGTIGVMQPGPIWPALHWQQGSQKLPTHATVPPPECWLSYVARIFLLWADCKLLREGPGFAKIYSRKLKF
jgi:hypothetical protein